MKIDVSRNIAAVVRAVEAGKHEGESVRCVVVERAYDSDIADLWAAISSAERIRGWLTPISGDLRLGGRFQLEGNAGGTITACEPPRHLAVSWEFGGEVSWVFVRLTKDAPGGTRLRLEHLAPDTDHWTQYGPGAAGVGWELGLTGLDTYLRSGVAVDQDDAMAWMVSAEGKDFVTRSSEAWREAAIAGGADPAWAHDAAARTTAFYTGAPAEAPQE